MKISTLAILFASTVYAQTARTPAFEAVSIKFHPEPIHVSSGNTSGTLATWTATDLLSLIVDAYNLKYYQVIGGPPWIASAHYDIVARAGGDAPITKESERQMIQTMLAERFHLKVHREMREIPVYALMVSKSGSKLKDPDMNSRQGSVMVNATGVHMNYSHNTMQQLADHLSDTAGRPVLDKTNLPGEYAFKLDFSTNGNEFEIPSMPTALREQLGLRLESQKAPVEVLVIDSVEKPSEN